MSKSYNYILAICLCFSVPILATDVYASEAAKSDKIETIEINGSKGIIASQKISSDMLNQCSRAAPDANKVSGYWAPSNQELEVLEKLLPEYLKQQNHTLKDLSKYRRIYAGIAYNNREVIYVDFAVMYDHDPDWTKQLHVVCDGGDSFFGVEFDIKSQTFSHLYFNGPL